MPGLLKMSLRNCGLVGAVESLTNLSSLKYIDLSRNQFHGQLPSGQLPANLTTIIFSYNNLTGPLPENIEDLQNLQYLAIRNNQLNGTVPVNLGTGVKFPFPSSRLILDLRNNIFIANNYTSYPSNVTFWLNGNLACSSEPSYKECSALNKNIDIKDIDYKAPLIPLPEGCDIDTCDPSLNQEPIYGIDKCFCASPLLVGYRLKSPSFSYFPPYEDRLLEYLCNGLILSLYQVNISDFEIEPGPRLRMNIKLFPNLPSHQFNNSEVLRLYDALARWKISDNELFGPTELIYFSMLYPYNQAYPFSSKENGLNKAVFDGIISACVLFAASLLAFLVLVLSKRYGYFRGGAYWRSGKFCRQQQLKIVGIEEFTFEEMALATQKFSDSMQVGQGGYGKVYKGILKGGRLVAIKRAKEGSLQGATEFYTEIELLSRVHHRNLVSLVGYCDDKGEQMLVYEYMVNGTLRDHLSARSQRPLNFHSRVHIALGSARGILYLHTEANPPIFHRDIKASNILLDERNNAKVTDFGLSRLAPECNADGVAPEHVTTVVKGTPGYLDPEYFLTRKLTDKSDVYSLGVVLLELITGMHPISHGKNLVREVNLAYEAGMMLSLVDPRMGSYPVECLDPLVRLAMSCCKGNTSVRPSMADVVRQLEDILCMTPVPESCSDNLDIEMRELRMPTSSDSYRSVEMDGAYLLSMTIPNVLPR